jgi:hypothetical protein
LVKSFLVLSFSLDEFPYFSDADSFTYLLFPTLVFVLIPTLVLKLFSMNTYTFFNDYSYKRFREGKEKGYKEASADDKYLQNIVSPFYQVMTAKVDEIVDDKKVGKNDEKNNPKKSSFYDEFAKLKERFNASVADADDDTKMNKNMTNTSSSSSLKRRQSSMHNRKNEDNENLTGVMEHYIDTFLASRDEKLTPIELEKKKKLLKERIVMRDRNILEAFNAADKVENFVSTYTNGADNGNKNTIKSELNRNNDILNNEINDGLNVEESELKNKLNQILNASSRNEIFNKLNGNDRSISKNNDNVVRNLDRGTSVFLTLEDEFFKFKKEHYDAYDPEKELREKNDSILISKKMNIRREFRNNRILSTAELNEIYAKESLQNKKITNELKNKGKEIVYSYTDYLLSRSKSFIPFNFEKNAQVLTNKNSKKSLRSNNRK